MSITPLSRSQWWSVLKNTVFAAVAAGVAAYSANGDVRAAVVVGVMVVIKVIEKAFTPAQK